MIPDDWDFETCRVTRQQCLPAAAISLCNKITYSLPNTGSPISCGGPRRTKRTTGFYPFALYRPSRRYDLSRSMDVLDVADGQLSQDGSEVIVNGSSINLQASSGPRVDPNSLFWILWPCSHRSAGTDLTPRFPAAAFAACCGLLNLAFCGSSWREIVRTFSFSSHPYRVR